MSEAIQFIQENMDMYILCIKQHLFMSVITVLVSGVIGLPLGYICAKSERVSSAILAAVNTFRIIPAIAIFMMLIPLIGIGMEPAIIALTIYALPTVVVNTMGGIRNVNKSVIESASGMGMSSKDICFKVELPLAWPMIFTGIKIATVETVAGATIASFVGGGGLGQIVYMGILSGKTGPLLAGSITVAIMVIIIDLFASLTDKLCTKDYK